MDKDARNRSGSPQVPADSGQQEGINPLDPRSMPRAEDDEQTFARSPEYHDRPPGDNRTPRGGDETSEDEHTPHEGGVS